MRNLKTILWLLFSLFNTTAVLAQCGVSITEFPSTCFPTVLVADATGTAPFSYLWELSGIPIGVNDQVEASFAGEYCLTITDGDDCVASECVILPAQISPLDLQLLVVEQPYCSSDDSGALSAAVSGGTPPYTFMWADGTNTPSLNDLTPGTYTLTVIDDAGCDITTSVELEAMLLMDAGEDQRILCQADYELEGKVLSPSVFGSSAITPIEFSDSNAEIIEAEILSGYIGPDPLPTDSPQNPEALLVEIGSVVGQPGAIVDVPFTVTNFDDVVGFAFTIEYDASIFQFVGIDDLNTNVPGLSVAGNFGTPPAIADGFIMSNYFNNELSPTTLPDGSLLFNLRLLVLDNPTFPDLSSQWTGPNGFTSTDLRPTVTESGVYTLRVTDSSQPDCWVEDSVTITFMDELFIDLGPDTLEYCEGNALELSPSIEGGGGLYFYEWNTGETTATIMVDPTPGEQYAVTVTDVDLACVGVDSVMLMPGTPADCSDPCESSDLSFSFIVTNTTCAGNNDGCIEIIASGGAPPYTYALDGVPPSSDPFVCNLSAGTYEVIVTDANGCIAVGAATIAAPPAMNLDVIIVQQPTCETSQDGILEVFVTGGVPPYSFLWANGATTNSINGLGPGIYGITVTDANGCSMVNEVELLPLTIADAGPDQFLSCNTASVILDGSNSSAGPDITYTWTDSEGTVISNAPTVEVNVPGLYQLTVENTAELFCFSYDDVAVVENFPLPPFLDYSLVSCDSALLTYEVNIVNFTGTWTLPDDTQVPAETIVGTNQAGTHTLSLTDLDSGCTWEDSILVELDPLSCVTLKGRVVHDTLPDCTADPAEPGLANWLVVIQGGDDIFYAVSQAGGFYEQDVPVGDYEVYLIPPTPLWLPCSSGEPISLPDPGSMATLDLPAQELEPCPELSIDIALPLLRRCWTRTLYVDYCNDGTEIAEDAYAEIFLDEAFSFISASAPIIGQDGNLYTFDLGDVEVNECGSFSITVIVSCDALVGQSLCAEAKIYPNQPCEPENPLWSGASLRVEAECAPDQVTFRVSNEGTGNMEVPQPCIVIEDGVMLFVIPDSLKLDAGEFYEYELPANGSTYRLEVDQTPFHPSLDNPLAIVEGCGENEFGGISTGFVNNFSLGDADPFLDVECRQVVAAYDPNDKHGFPRGYGEEHLIYPGTELEYLINFQNTGNDTAFLVVLRDTLSEHLDITSIRPGASSHAYTWDIENGNTLVFTFENILLPDSTTNLLGSQGFVEFKIGQRADLSLGTVIENSAAIYFDINEPIITNTTSHKLGKDFIEIINSTSDVEPAYQLKVVPNPAHTEAVITVDGWPTGTSTFELVDARGVLVRQTTFTGNTFRLERRELAAGVYFFCLRHGDGGAVWGRVVVRW